MEETGLDCSRWSGSHLSRFFISVLTYHLEKEALTLAHQFQDTPQPVSVSLSVVG